MTPADPRLRRLLARDRQRMSVPPDGYPGPAPTSASPVVGGATVPVASPPAARGGRQDWPGQVPDR